MNASPHGVKAEVVATLESDDTLVFRDANENGQHVTSDRSSRRTHRFPQVWERFVAASIVLCAMALSAFWAVRVPMFQEPDEIAHADAAFSYFDVGRPYVVAAATSGDLVMPQTRYLARTTAYRRLRYDAHAAVPTGYGSLGYFRTLDEHAPSPSGNAPAAGSAIPYALKLYPSPYYYLIGLSMRAGWATFGHSLSAAFYAGRFINVAMLGATLSLSYVLFVLLRLSPISRLMLLGGVSFFPMSTWIGAYIQPDNQTTLLMMASLVGALALRERPNSLPFLMGFGAVECGLGVTKLHYAFVAIVAFGVALRGVYASMKTRERLRALAIGIALPVLVAFGGRYLSPAGLLGTPPSGMAYARMTPSDALQTAVTDGLHSITDAVFGGEAFQSFWFHFGIRSGAAFLGRPAQYATVAIVILTLLTFVAWMSLQIRLVGRLRKVATRYGIARALRFIGTDPFANLYILLSTLLFSVYAFTGGYLTLQGRYWYPILIPIAALSVRTFARAVPRARERSATRAACALWLAYAAISAPSAALAMQNGFYTVRSVRPRFELGTVERVAIDGRNAGDVQTLRIRAGAVMSVRGAALDTSTALPASDVRFRIDAGLAQRARTGLRDRTLAIVFNDELLARGGFAFDVATDHLTPGSHTISILAIEARAPDGLPIETIRFDVTRR